MSTRKLIAIALACGLAILLAGGIQLMLLRGKSSTQLLQMGETASLTSVDIRPDGLNRVGTELVLRYELRGGSPAAGDGWSLSRSGAVRVDPVGSPVCVATKCEARFPAVGIDQDSVVARYRMGDEVQGWALAIS